LLCSIADVNVLIFRSNLPLEGLFWKSLLQEVIERACYTYEHAKLYADKIDDLQDNPLTWEMRRREPFFKKEPQKLSPFSSMALLGDI